MSLPFLLAPLCGIIIIFLTLELIRHDDVKALEILKKDLKVFASDNESLFKEMTQLLALNDFRYGLLIEYLEMIHLDCTLVFNEVLRTL